jgi:hypothetical protein
MIYQQQPSTTIMNSIRQHPFASTLYALSQDPVLTSTLQLHSNACALTQPYSSPVLVLVA